MLIQFQRRDLLEHSIVYNRVQTFNRTDQEREYVSRAKQWSLRYSANTEDGRKSYYDCKVSRSCPVKMYLVFEHRNQDVHLYKTEAAHNHALKQVGLSESVKLQIDELLTLKIRRLLVRVPNSATGFCEKVLRGIHSLGTVKLVV